VLQRITGDGRYEKFNWVGQNLGLATARVQRVSMSGRKCNGRDGMFLFGRVWRCLNGRDVCIAWTAKEI